MSLEDKWAIQEMLARFSYAWDAKEAEDDGCHGLSYHIRSYLCASLGRVTRARHGHARGADAVAWLMLIVVVKESLQ